MAPPGDAPGPLKRCHLSYRHRAAKAWRGHRRSFAISAAVVGIFKNSSKHEKFRIRTAETSLMSAAIDSYSMNVVIGSHATLDERRNYSMNAARGSHLQLIAFQLSIIPRSAPLTSTVLI
jgi:hypothetical protein